MKFKIYKTIANIICFAGLIGITAYLIATWQSIPAEVPGHYNAAGEIDRMSSKSSLLMLPIMGWIMCILISVLEKFPQAWNTGVKVTEQNKERVYGICRSMLFLVKTFVAVDFVFMEVFMIKGLALPIWFTPVFLVVLFGTIIVHIVLLFRSK